MICKPNGQSILHAESVNKQELRASGEPAEEEVAAGGKRFPTERSHAGVHSGDRGPAIGLQESLNHL
jgi:hypothetical protein